MRLCAGISVNIYFRVSMEKLSDGEMNASPETRTDMESIICHISGPMEQNKKQQQQTTTHCSV